MQRSVQIYGLTLIAIGLAGYGLGGFEHVTALIPAVLGILAAGAAWLLGARAVPLAIAALVIAGLALVGSGSALADLPQAVAGDPAVNPLAVYARAATAVASLLLLVAVAAGWFRRRPAA
jgi:hypothetical protein